MGTSMEIIVNFSDKAFTATAYIILDEKIRVNDFSFILNDSLIINEITCNYKQIDFNILSTSSPVFRALSKTVLLESDDYIHSITVTYSGTVAFSIETRSCWHNIITRDIKSLSFYSVWYPQDTSIAITHDKVVILNGRDYFVVKGKYNEVDDVWEYGGKGYDPFNIVLYRKSKLQTISNQLMNVYFIDDSIKAQAEKSIAIYKDIIDYYNGNLFKRIEIPILDVACASPAITVGGGYRRKDFMWCTVLGNNIHEITHLFAHETAHIWCTGANSGSWEDWLNETTAEWAVLLFALQKKDNELFDFIMKPKLDKFESLPPIKTIDNSRPEGVHDKGTVLFYEMYSLYGLDVIHKTIRLFTDLSDKSTASLVKNLYDMNENVIAGFIEESIVR